MKLLSLTKIKKNARVLVRVDADVAMARGGASVRGGAVRGAFVPEARFRLDAALPTLKFLLARGCVVTLMGHRGRPDGKKVAALSLAPIQKYFETHLKIKLNCLPNTRFDAREEKNDATYARELARGQDFFVNESFATAHRAHASTVGVAQLLPHAAGLRFAEEVAALTAVRKHPAHPLVLILGGVKLETKLPVIKNFLARAEKIFVVGAAANTFMGAACQDIGASIAEPEFFGAARVLMQSGKIFVPHVHNVVWHKNKIVDIGAGTLAEIKKQVRALQPRTIIWNGPAGMFEKPPYDAGTTALAHILARAGQSGAHVIAGGGETVSAILRACPTENFTPRGFAHISVGGGAMLEFLAGKKLPAVEILKK